MASIYLEVLELLEEKDRLISNQNKLISKLLEDGIHQYNYAITVEDGEGN